MTNRPTNEQSDAQAGVPEHPQTNPEGTLDALENQVPGPTPAQQRDEDPSTPAFEQDIAPEDATAEHGGHVAGEPPS